MLSSKNCANRKFRFHRPMRRIAKGVWVIRPRNPLQHVGRRIEAEYQVPVKHLHTFGGCEGALYFSKDWIVYETDHPKDARTWKRNRDVESVWSLNRFQLEVHVFEENKRASDKTRRFRFQLKEPLDESYYEQLRREFFPGR